jgi:hypothetical protein
MLAGTILAIVELLFADGVPSAKEYAREKGVAPSTFRRSARWLLKLLPPIFRSRRPGPPSEETEETAREKVRGEAVRKLQDLWSWVQKNRSETKKNDCYTPEAKQRIASLSEEILTEGTLTVREIAAELEMNERQLRRICDEVREAGGAPPEPKSRRPHNTGKLAKEIQLLIRRIEDSNDSRSAPYTGADIKRIIEKSYKEKLLEYHGSETITDDTVRKYMRNPDNPEEEAQQEHPRGSYHYPEPFQQVAIDTSFFKLFGWTFYFITVFEVGGRLNLLTRVFLRENARAVVEVLEEFLRNYPGVEVVVIDRGRPYLNEEVKALLEENGKVRLVCPPETPTAKAAAERHFRTLKEVIRPAVSQVFPQEPRWRKNQVAKLLEMGTVVFQQLYHRIPQEGIDGQSPAERIQSFDPLKASAALVNLFARARDSEPTDEYARKIHQRFQLPGEEKDTVKKLRRFRTRTLRKVVEKLAPELGPPLKSYIYDPLGYIAARTHELSEKENEEFIADEYYKARSKRLREEEDRKKAHLEREEKECLEHPERFVERVLKTVVFSIEKGPECALKPTARQLKELLESLSRKLGRAFSNEVKRLKTRVAAFSEDARVRETAEALLEELVSALSPVEATAGAQT